MPHLQFWPGDFEPLPVTVWGEDVPSGAALDDGARIRRVGDDPVVYDPNAPLLEQAWFETVHVPMAALTEIFGLHYRLSPLASGRDPVDFVGVQISIDDGGTYLAWTGAEWEEQDYDGEYTSRADFDENADTLPLVNPRTVGFRFRLTADGNESPILRDVELHVEWRYDAHDDAHETLKTVLEQNLRVPRRERARPASDGATVTIRSEYVPDADRPIVVYDLTADPLRNEDLFASYDAETQVVTLADAVDPGDDIEIRFDGSAPVIVVRADEMVTLAQLPITIVRVAERLAVDPGNNVGMLADYKIGTDTCLVRERQLPVVYELALRLEHHTPSPREAVVSVDRMRAALSTSFRMVATGETPSILEDVPGRLEDAVGESFYVGHWSGRMRLYFHAQAYTQYVGVKTLLLDIAPWGGRWSSDNVRVE